MQGMGKDGTKSFNLAQSRSVKQFPEEDWMLGKQDIDVLYNVIT